MRKRYLLAMGLLAMGLACSGCSKSSGQLDGGIIRIAYNQAPTHPHYQALERAGERFKEATGGRYEFLIYPNEVLGDQRATLELIQNGAIQMAIVNNAMVENYNKDFQSWDFLIYLIPRNTRRKYLPPASWTRCLSPPRKRALRSWRLTPLAPGMCIPANPLRRRKTWTA